MVGQCKRRIPVSTATDAWLQQINNQVSHANRILFRTQLNVPISSLKPAQLRLQLPQLVAFVDSIALNGRHEEQYGLIFTAFGDHRAQWLNHSAIESGTTSVLCHLLISHLPSSSSTLERLIHHILLNPVLSICHNHHDSIHSCQWRARTKLEYYAMPCATVWDVLLPFLVLAVKRAPETFTSTISTMIQKQSPSAVIEPLGCRFSHLIGLFRLLERMEDSHMDKAMETIVLCTMHWTIVRHVHNEEVLLDYEDALFIKWFDLLQTWVFKCVAAPDVTRRAMNALLQDLNDLGTNNSTSRRLAILTSIASVAIRSLSLVSLLNSIPIDKQIKSTRYFLIGLVAHIEIIEEDSAWIILSLLLQLVDAYKATEAKDAQQEFLFWAVYIVVCRQQVLKQTSHERAARLFEVLRERLCHIVLLSDFECMPLHWMNAFWQICFDLKPDEIALFMEQAVESQRAQDNSSSHVLYWKEWETIINCIPHRFVNNWQLVSQVLGGQYQERVRSIERPVSQENTIERHFKKRKRIGLVLTDPQKTRRHVFLPDDVMEQICGFMSAKRLCRLALVCRAFAQIARSPRVWQRLFYSLVANSPPPLQAWKCLHQSDFIHDWRAMYQAKRTAVKKWKRRYHQLTIKIQKLESRMVFDSLTSDNRTSTLEKARRQLTTLESCKMTSCEKLLLRT